MPESGSREPRSRVTVDGAFAEAVAKRIYGRIFSPDSWYDLPTANRVRLIEEAWDLLDAAADDATEAAIARSILGMSQRMLPPKSESS